MTKASGILVLGGSGFAGQRLLPHLPPPVYIISRRQFYGLRHGVHAFRTNLDDIPTLKQILPKCRWVVHLASDSTPGTSAGKPRFEAEHNIVPTVRFLDVLQSYPQVKLIYLSSGGAVYGNPGHTSVHEDTPLNPLSYYAAGKITNEAFIAALTNQSPRYAAILRPSNFYGPGQRYRPGFGIIPTILEHQRIGKPLQIWGDGENVRDYLFIDDFVHLCLLMLQNKNTEPGTHIYNVGSGFGYSLNQLCELLEKVTGEIVLREYRSTRVVDVRHIVLDSSRIQSACGWQALTPLEEGLQKTVRWWTDNVHQAKPHM
ncbi:MAG: NAD-dependent epimerase/dehydratase family protein [Syntrophales bacterium]|jgi:UDP-glucose 4-epimerase|nr:NAD-dependent epimerase/dehydratase family protein [Syntrophales bacterium]